MNKTKSVRVETPLGTIESDSGSHLIDIGTILIVIAFFITLKTIISKYIK
tara:strand:+ start:920 stop:1069 length:150 start_codon:yes stop_codon:yes gene_type:complete